MPQGDGAPARIDPRVIVGQAHLPRAGQSLRGKGLIELDDVEVVHSHAQPGQQLVGGRHGPDAHGPRRHAGDSHPEYAGLRLEVVSLSGRFRCYDQSRGAVVDAGCVTGRDGPAREQRPESGQSFH